MPEDREPKAPSFLRRHSSLWEKPPPVHADGLWTEPAPAPPDDFAEFARPKDEENIPDFPNKRPRGAPVVDEFRAENMQLGGEPIDPIDAHPVHNEVDPHIVQVGWMHGSRGSFELLPDSSLAFRDL